MLTPPQLVQSQVMHGTHSEEFAVNQVNSTTMPTCLSPTSSKTLSQYIKLPLNLTLHQEKISPTEAEAHREEEPEINVKIKIS